MIVTTENNRNVKVLRIKMRKNIRKIIISNMLYLKPLHSLSFDKNQFWYQNLADTVCL